MRLSRNLQTTQLFVAWWKRRSAELEYEVGVRNTESKLMFKNESEEDGVSLQDSQKIAQIVLKRVIDQ